MTDAEASPPVVVVGAGIVGVSTAIWLQRAGHRVVLVDRKGPAEGTSYGNGGVLASCSIVPVTVPGLWRKAPGMLFDRAQPLYLKWGYLPRLLPWLWQYMKGATAERVHQRAATLFPIIGDSLADHQALAAGTGAERWIVPSDYLYVYNDRAHYQDSAFLWEVFRKFGFSPEELEAEAFRAYDPCFGPDLTFAARMGGHGRITDPGRYVKALAAYFETQGGQILLADVEDVARENGAVTGVRLKGETLACSAVVLCAGAWSAPLAAKLGVRVPLESERGYHLELWEPSVMPRAPVMIASGKFVATPMEGRLRLAGVVEFGGLEAPPSRAPFELLESNIRKAIPGIAWKERVEWMGHRPSMSDSIPMIGAFPGISGAFAGFGHDHVGLTGGPKTGRLLAQLISGQTPNIDLAPYAPGRFQ